MATQKTKQEIEAIVLKLLNRRISLPEISIMNEKNWGLIDTQVNVLRNDLPQSEIELLCKNESDAFKVGVDEARLWLDGKISDFDLMGGNV